MFSLDYIWLIKSLPLSYLCLNCFRCQSSSDITNVFLKRWSFTHLNPHAQCAYNEGYKCRQFQQFNSDTIKVDTSIPDFHLVRFVPLKLVWNDSKIPFF